MASQAPFERLVRFEDDKAKETYGNIPLSVETDSIIGSSVETLDGDIKSGFKKSGTKATIRKLLSPVPATHMVICIGLNYRHHAEECKIAIPTYPPVFAKPVDAITGPFDDIHVDSQLQSKVDYEGELTIVIGTDARNVKAADALDYVLGFTIGNDVTARDFQFPASVGGGQAGYAKSADQFGPIGPCVTATSVIGDVQQLVYTTKVNGEVRQKTSTNDMVWGVAQIVEHLSRGRTLRAGTAIMTGSPSGIGYYMDPPTFLKDGDVVEIEIPKIGLIRNKFVFD